MKVFTSTLFLISQILLLLFVAISFYSYITYYWRGLFNYYVSYLYSNFIHQDSSFARNINPSEILSVNTLRNIFRFSLDKLVYEVTKLWDHCMCDSFLGLLPIPSSLQFYSCSLMISQYSYGNHIDRQIFLYHYGAGAVSQQQSHTVYLLDLILSWYRNTILSIHLIYILIHSDCVIF